MSEFGGLRKHENNQHALVPPKTECGCPSGGGIRNGRIRYPSYGATQKERKKERKNTEPCFFLSFLLSYDTARAQPHLSPTTLFQQKRLSWREPISFKRQHFVEWIRRKARWAYFCHASGLGWPCSLKSLHFNCHAVRPRVPFHSQKLFSSEM